MRLDELESLNLAIRMAGFRWRRANILYHKVSMYAFMIVYRQPCTKALLPAALHYRQPCTTERPALPPAMHYRQPCTTASFALPAALH